MHAGTMMKGFHIFVREKFTWIDNDVKRFMSKAFCAGVKYAEQEAKKGETKK